MLVIIIQGQFNLHPLTDDAVAASLAAADVDAALRADKSYAQWMCKIARNSMSNALLLLLSLRH